MIRALLELFRDIAAQRALLIRIHEERRRAATADAVRARGER